MQGFFFNENSFSMQGFFFNENSFPMQVAISMNFLSNVSSVSNDFFFQCK
jgi:hypothetical protein